MKRTLSLTAAVAASALVLTACGSGGGASQSEEPQDVSVGIAQFVEHPSLDAAREGFVAALEEGGYKKATT